MCVFIIVSISIYVLFISSVHNYVIDIVSLTSVFDNVEQYDI